MDARATLRTYIGIDILQNDSILIIAYEFA